MTRDVCVCGRPPATNSVDYCSNLCRAWASFGRFPDGQKRGFAEEDKQHI